MKKCWCEHNLRGASRELYTFLDLLKVKYICILVYPICEQHWQSILNRINVISTMLLVLVSSLTGNVFFIINLVRFFIVQKEPPEVFYKNLQENSFSHQSSFLWISRNYQENFFNRHLQATSCYTRLYIFFQARASESFRLNILKCPHIFHILTD